MSAALAFKDYVADKTKPAASGYEWKVDATNHGTKVSVKQNLKNPVNGQNYPDLAFVEFPTATPVDGLSNAVPGFADAVISAPYDSLNITATSFHAKKGRVEIDLDNQTASVKVDGNVVFTTNVPPVSGQPGCNYYVP